MTATHADAAADDARATAGAEVLEVSAAPCIVVAARRVCVWCCVVGLCCLCGLVRMRALVYVYMLSIVQVHQRHGEA